MDILLIFCILDVAFGVSAELGSPTLAANAVYDGNHKEDPLVYYEGNNTFKAEVNFSVSNPLPKSATLTLTCRMKMAYSNDADNFKHNEVFVQKYLFDIAPNDTLENTQNFSFSTHISEKGGFNGQMQCSAHLSFVDTAGRQQDKSLTLRNVPRVYAYSASVDGAWTEWSLEQSCVVSCGENTTFRTRNCTNPAPVGNGADCPGDELDGCSTEECIAPPSLIKKDVLKLLDVRLPGKKFKRLYRSTEDGTSGTSFHDKCDFKEPTLTIGEDNSTGFYYGGYTTKSWESKIHLNVYGHKDPEAFIFKIPCSLTGACTNIEIFNALPNSTTTMLSSYVLPNFGPELDFNNRNHGCLQGQSFLSTKDKMNCSGEWKIIETYSVI